jgi:Taurine catabolism dioxygenase TauD, TfdA family
VSRIPLSSSAAWLGVEQRKRDDWTRHLSELEKAELDSAIRLYRAAPRTLTQIKVDDYALAALGQTIRAWMRELDDGRGFVLVRGGRQLRSGRGSFAYWLIGLRIGVPVPQNRKGDLLGHVRDDGADLSNPAVACIERAPARIPYDGADIIGLLCLQTAKVGGVSRIASSVSIFNEVMRRRPDLMLVLFHNFYCDREADALPGDRPYFPFPICRFDQGRLGML